MKIYIIGHTSPDLDSIASAMEYTEFLQERGRYEGAQLIPVRPGEPNKETQFVFEKFGVEMPKALDDCEISPEDRFILVDHNEEAQRHNKVTNEQVLEIVDHHKINVNFAFPILIDVQPYGSTSTIIYERFNTQDIAPSKGASGLILASILSDTQGLKSSTTTDYDTESAKKLARELGEDLEELTFEIFKAKSDLSGLSAMEIAQKDSKVFNFGGKKVFINQVETVEPEKVLEEKEKIVEALEEIKTQDGLDQAYCVITDILKSHSQVIYSTEEGKKVLEKAFGGVGESNLIDIGNLTSRKKEIAPEIEKKVGRESGNQSIKPAEVSG